METQKEYDATLKLQKKLYKLLKNGKTIFSPYCKKIIKKIDKITKPDQRIVIKSHWLNGREYYACKETNETFARIEDFPGQFVWYSTSKDGEPSYKTHLKIIIQD